MKCLIVNLTSRAVPRLDRALRSAGMAVEAVTTRPEAVWRAEDGTVDAVLLCVDRTDGSEVEVVRAVRAVAATVPLLLLAGRTTPDDIVAVLDAGADDAIARPVRFREIVARLRAVDRRRDIPVSQVITVGDVTLDPAAHEARLGDAVLPLTPRLFALLGAFLRRPGQTLTRDQLLAAAWDGDADPLSNVVDQAVAELRRQLRGGVGHRAAGATHIQTVRGVGYRWRAVAPAPPPAAEQRADPAPSGRV